MLAVPFITGYAVLVHRAVDIRGIARATAQYALASYTLRTVLAGLLAVPLLVQARLPFPRT